MSEANASLKYVCIFGGGAIRGVSYAGTVRALEELNITPSTFAGSSVGAIFAGLLALGYKAEELKDIFMKVNFELFRDIHFGFGKDFALSKGEVFLNWLRELIEKKYYGDNYVKGKNKPVTFDMLDKKLIIITTDLTNFKYKEFSKFETPDVEIAYAIRVSATMPGLMTPVDCQNSLLMDGDLQKSWPLWLLSKNLCPDEERVLEFRLEGGTKGKVRNTLEFLNTVYSCVTSIATDFVMQKYAHKDKFDYIKINTGSIVIVDFNQPKSNREKLMEMGYEQTMLYFKSDIIRKKRELLKPYRLLSKHLGKIESAVCSAKVQKAKKELGNLYLNMYEIKKEIDEMYFTQINEFKKDYLESVEETSFGGVFGLKNQKLFNTKIKKLNSDIKDKIAELESYIFKS